MSPPKQYFCTLPLLIGFPSPWTSIPDAVLWERSAHACQLSHQALAADGELTEAEIIFLMYTDMPRVVCPTQTHNTNNIVSVLQSDVTWQIWVTAARHADFDFRYLGQSRLLCRGEQPPDGGRKDLTRDYISLQICKKGSFRPLWTLYLLSSIPCLTTSLAEPSADRLFGPRIRVMTAEPIKI